MRSEGSGIKIHRNFKEALTIKPGFGVEGIHGGRLLGVRAQDFICFYDWTTGKVGAPANSLHIKLLSNNNCFYLITFFYLILHYLFALACLACLTSCWFRTAGLGFVGEGNSVLSPCLACFALILPARCGMQLHLVFSPCLAGLVSFVSPTCLHPNPTSHVTQTHIPTHTYGHTLSLLQVVRRIDVAARGVYWSEGGAYVIIASEASFFMLEYMADLVESYVASGQVGAAFRMKE